MALGIRYAAEEFTPEWMTAALRAGGVLERAKVVSVRPSSLGEGFGLLGSLSRLWLEYDRPEPGAPATVVVKFPAVAEYNRSLARQYRVYEREYRFFENIAPTITAKVPRRLYAEYDAATGDAVIVLEDLAPRRVGDQLVPPAIEEIRQAVDDIANLHAAWWGKADGEEVAWVPRLDDPTWLQVGQSLEAFWPAFQGQFGHLISPIMKATGDALPEKLPGILAQLSAAPATLIHCDLRLDNLFFPTAAGHEPLVIIDWQLMSRGKGVYDIAYLLSQSVEPETRRAIEEEVLERYHGALLASGVTGYSTAALREDYRLATLWCMVYPVAAGGGMDLANERGTALATAMARRSFTAIEDLKAHELMG